MKVRMLLAVVVGSLLSGNLYSFIYEAKVLRAGNERERYHYVIGLSDFHDKQHPSNGEQQKAVAHLLNSCSREHTKIVLEDLSSQGHGGCASCGTFYVDSRGGILGGLAQWATAKGFEVDNAEFRYCRVASLGPILNSSAQDPRSFSSAANISLANIMQEIDAVTTAIRSYKDDGKPLERAYTEVLDALHKEIQGLGIADNTALSIADYVTQQSAPADRLALVKNLLTFDSNLLDLLLVHSALHTDKKTVIVIAGGAHIDRIAELLKNSGYESVYETDVAFHNEYDLNRCLGSNIIEGEFCVHPQPIDLSGVEKYLL